LAKKCPTATVTKISSEKLLQNQFSNQFHVLILNITNLKVATEMKQISQESKPTSKFDLEYELQKNKKKTKIDKSTWKKKRMVEEERAKKVQKTDSNKNPSSSSHGTIEINSEDEDEFLLNSTVMQQELSEEEVVPSPSLLNPATILALEQARNAKRLIELREKRKKNILNLQRVIC
jgi:hypothetical protein